MPQTINISEPLTLESVSKFITENQKVTIDQKAFEAIRKCNDYLLQKISVPGSVFYGINTGFGSLCDTQISSGDLVKLQENLLMSHACGMGETVPDDVVKLMLLFKIKSLSLGYSGVKKRNRSKAYRFFKSGIISIGLQARFLRRIGRFGSFGSPLFATYWKGKNRE